MPPKEAWARESPRRDMPRSMMKVPMMAAATATSVPAKRARCMKPKSSMSSRPMERS